MREVIQNLEEGEWEALLNSLQPSETGSKKTAKGTWGTITFARLGHVSGEDFWKFERPYSMFPVVKTLIASILSVLRLAIGRGR